MKQKFRVTWQVSESDLPSVVSCDNWYQLSGCLETLVELCALSVDISVINE